MPHRRSRKIEAIAIGGSAGSVDAFQTVLRAVSPRSKLPIFAVIHLPASGPNLLPSLFTDRLGLSAKEAEDKETIQRGMLYFAPPNYHLLIERDFSLSLSSEEPMHFSRPSIDLLFESAADVYGAGLLGILLTGANEDGAKGLKAIANGGGKTWVQDPSTAYAAVMPDAAIKLFNPDFIGDLSAIGAKLEQLIRSLEPSQRSE